MSSFTSVRKEDRISIEKLDLASNPQRYENLDTHNMFY